MISGEMCLFVSKGKKGQKASGGRGLSTLENMAVSLTSKSGNFHKALMLITRPFRCSSGTRGRKLIVDESQGTSFLSCSHLRKTSK